ncbi:MAG: threonine synthase [Deltaproteobacteria bacterium]|nr:threonine synthase [Deltaproteobacteria bacterium]
MGFVKGLRCRECGEVYPESPVHVCELCFGPLEVVYDYDKIKKILTKDVIAPRSKGMWRYKELLPIKGEPVVGYDTGFTPLIKANNLAKILGVKEIYIKNDTVNHPTFSFKDRVVSVAISKAKEFGFDTVACASTGNLANSVAANAATCGMKSYVFIPYNLEQAKIINTQVYGANVISIKGNYDEVNRLSSEIAGKYGWAFVNINIRPYYAEGSKTLGFEVAEQLGWRVPKNIVIPMASGSLLTKVYKAFKELHELGLVPDLKVKIYGAQATGCSPISTAVKEHQELFRPVIPKTIAKSLAIGNPADGFYAIDTMNKTGGWAEDVTDNEVIDGIKLLASAEGIFAETAGGVTIAVTRKLIENGKIPKDESIVVLITGNGLKTQEVLINRVDSLNIIPAKLEAFDELMKGKEKSKTK